MSSMTTFICGLAMLIASASVGAADPVKVGVLTTLSGPGAALGVDIRDAMQLYVKRNGGKLGGRPAELLVSDDQLNAGVATQAVEKLILRDHVDFVTGIVFSAVLLPVLPKILDANIFYLSPNTGPKEYAGEKCHPGFFAVAWQNEDLSAAMGTFLSQKGIKSVYGVAPNYPGGVETLDGFKRTYKGKYQEMYTKLGQLDYGVELSNLRAAKPEAIFMFLPGGMGINFIKQFVGAGMSSEIQLYVPGFSADEDTIKPLQDVLLGTFNASQWAHDLDNDANRAFVKAFTEEYKRLPTMYAAQGWDTIALIDSAVREVKGRTEDKKAVRRALEAAKFQSVRGSFKFNHNHYPIHDIYMRVVTKDAQGRITNRSVGTIVQQQSDPYATHCKMAP